MRASSSAALYCSQRLSQVAAPVVDLGEAADRRQVFRSAREHPDQLGLRLVVLTELDEGAPERHARRQVRRMNLEAGPARIDRLLILPGATQLLGQLGEGNRRRILLDPAPQVIDA